MTLPGKKMYLADHQVSSIRDRVRYWKDRIDTISVDLEETRRQYFELRSRYEDMLRKFNS